MKDDLAPLRNFAVGATVDLALVSGIIAVASMFLRWMAH